jgi:rSAM/selenodomain-associated transferase 2
LLLMARNRAPLLSVIVPLAPGETAGAALLAQLCGLSADSEIVLVDAGSAALATVDGWSGDAMLRVLRSAPGRARQLNLGANNARGRWLWFLHADTALDEEALSVLRRFIITAHGTLGYFQLAFADDGPRLTRLNALGANLRAQGLRMPFGDQGLVIEREVFLAAGAYDETMLHGEDHLLVWALRARGVRLRALPATLTTSARKYARDGWLRTTARHVARTAWQAWHGWLRARGMARP